MSAQIIPFPGTRLEGESVETNAGRARDLYLAVRRKARPRRLEKSTIKAVFAQMIADGWRP